MIMLMIVVIIINFIKIGLQIDADPGDSAEAGFPGFGRAIFHPRFQLRLCIKSGRFGLRQTPGRFGPSWTPPTREPIKTRPIKPKDISATNTRSTITSDDDDESNRSR